MDHLQPLQIEQTETVLNQKSVKYPLLLLFSRFMVRCLLQNVAGEASLGRTMRLETCWPHKTDSLASNNSCFTVQKWICAGFLNQHCFSLLDLEGLKVAHRENLWGSSEGTLATHHTKFTVQADEK